ncbi:MAG: exodeoxyribonuclease VII small subunit [Verrucomicrobia bacterium]|nr:MAG: exodeoxyribonuclease VII small subunit [Verrucomicrobiota bacterium]
MPKRPTATQPSDPIPTFESALADLEAIVEAMENESLPLTELVSQYEKGSKLVVQCEAMLQGARERIELITLRPAKAGVASAELSADNELMLSGDSDEDSDDIRLF